MASSSAFAIRNSNCEYWCSGNFSKVLNKAVAAVDAIAMAFVMHQLWATVVLSGADASKHLLSNLKALEVCLDGEDIQLLRKFSESPSDYRETRSGLAWN